jgi:hypothetical protein
VFSAVRAALSAENMPLTGVRQLPTGADFPQKHRKSTQLIQ